MFPTVLYLHLGVWGKIMFLWDLPGSLSPPSPRCRVWLGSRTFSGSRVCCFSRRSERHWVGSCCGMTWIWCLICCWTPDWARWRRAEAARCYGSRTESESSVRAPTLTSDSRRPLLRFSDKYKIVLHHVSCCNDEVIDLYYWSKHWRYFVGSLFILIIPSKTEKQIRI